VIFLFLQVSIAFNSFTPPYRCSGVPESYATVLDLMEKAYSVQALQIKTALLHKAR